MKKLLMSLVVLIISASVSIGALTVYDSFSDEVSTNGVPAGWVSNSSGSNDHSRIDSGSLEYSGLTSAGNSWGLGQLAADYSRDIPDVTGLTAGDKVYYSFLMRLNSPLDGFSSGTFRLYNTADSSGTGLVVGWGTADPTNAISTMGFSLNNRNRAWNYQTTTNADFQLTPQTYTAADTVYLIVLGYNRGTNAATSSMNLWVNPDPATFSSGTPPAATLTIRSWTSGYGNEAVWNKLVYYTVGSGGGSGVENWQVDEVRVGRAWADMDDTSTGAPTPPVAAFKVTPTNGVGIVSLTSFIFTDTSTGSVTNRYWDFGDGTTTNLAGTVVQHIYSSAGTYSVAMTATGPAGTDTITKTDLITVSDPVAPMAAFTPSKTSGYAPLTVTFTDTSTGTVTNRSWDFGDGGTTNLTVTTSVAHMYAAAGTYTVALTVGGPSGSDTSTQADLITVQALPEGMFVIESDKADNSVGIRSNGTHYLFTASQSPLSVGDDNYTVGKAEACAIVVFKLPDLGGKAITAANLAIEASISYPLAAGYPVGLDLYGVRYSASKTVLTNDYAPITAPSGTLIQDNVWTLSSNAVYRLEPRETDASGDAALAAWITAQYTAGAVAGDYVFLRYATDQHIKSSLDIVSADSTSSASQIPVLTIVTETGEVVISPPPASVVTLGAVGGGQDIVNWTTAQGSGYVYSVYYSTNLLNGFLPLQTNLADTVHSLTSPVSASPVFYQIKAQ